MSCFAEKRETWVAKQNVVLWKIRGDKEESCITENYESGTKFYVRYLFYVISKYGWIKFDFI